MEETGDSLSGESFDWCSYVGACPRRTYNVTLGEGVP